MAAEKLNVAIFVFDDVEVLDFAGPFEVFSRTRSPIGGGSEARKSDETAPFNVFTVAKSNASTISAVGGLEVKPKHSFGDAPPIHILLVPGGFGTRMLLNDEETLLWVENAAAAARKITSVCTGAFLLAKVGILKGHRATTHWASLDTLGEIDPTIKVDRDSRYVDDGIITSAGVSAGIDMALYVVEQICGKEVADETARYMDYPRFADKG